MTLDFEPARGFGIYLHWPYCTRICPYCDFNVYAAKARDPAPLVEALKQDLTHWRARTGTRRVDSVFFGGGTPSLIPPRHVAELIDHIGALWELAPAVEISLEANPDDAPHFADMSAAGVNRLSLGVQSLDDEELTFLGRSHGAALARKAVETARGLFGSLSLDFIYALPGQGAIKWRRNLEEALSLGADHYSLYELSIEPGAAFSRAVRRGAWRPADEDAAADLYELTQEVCDKAGYPAYEISNHARDRAHRSRHNILYWRSGDWVGVGPGAHGRLTLKGRRIATTALDRPAQYQDQVRDRGSGAAADETLSVQDVAAERLIMGLRLSEGLPRRDVEGPIVRRLTAGVVDSLIGEGLLEPDPDALRLTRAGRLLADHVAGRLVDWL